MKKIFLLKAITAACLFVPLASQAASPATATFNVTVNLTPECKIVTPISGVVFPTYVAFGAAQTAPDTSLTVLCTRGLTPVNAGFDADPIIGATGNPPSTAPTISGRGVIRGLQYRLTADRVDTAGSAASASNPGTGDRKEFTISGTIPAGQAGDINALSSQTRTFRVTY